MAFRMNRAQSSSMLPSHHEWKQATQAIWRPSHGAFVLTLHTRAGFPRSIPIADLVSHAGMTLAHSAFSVHDKNWPTPCLHPPSPCLPVPTRLLNNGTCRRLPPESTLSVYSEREVDGGLFQSCILLAAALALKLHERAGANARNAHTARVLSSQGAKWKL